MTIVSDELRSLTRERAQVPTSACPRSIRSNRSLLKEFRLPRACHIWGDCRLNRSLGRHAASGQAAHGSANKQGKRHNSESLELCSCACLEGEAVLS